MNGESSFGIWVRNRRKALDLTQSELGRQIGCSESAIRKFESNKRRPSRELAARLADRLEISSELRELFLRHARLDATPGFDGHNGDHRRDPPDRHGSRGAHQSSTAGLPAQLTPLVGREQELAALRVQIERDDVRLLTLTGPAGVGKTRLAMAAAATVADRFEAVSAVLLAPIRDPELVIPVLARALGVPEPSSGPGHTAPADYIAGHLRDRRRLLLLDNFEHLLAVAPLIADLLARCPELTIFVTSRTKLHIRGEVTWTLLPLAMPGLRRLPALDELARVPAVALFIHCARAARAGFALTPQNAGAVVRICARLEGLPLAIELVAARCSLLSPQQLLAQLEQPLTVLANGPRDVQQRHRTLRDAIEWSYDLLSQDERQLFTRLAIFVGGCTLNAAGTVCDLDLGEIAGFQPSRPKRIMAKTLDALQTLVDSSLVHQTLLTDGDEPRLTMLEMIREYALERLDASGDADTIRRRHAAYFVALAEAAEPHLHHMDDPFWWDRLEGEHDNLVAALGWTVDRREDELALRLAGALWRFWYSHGQLAKGGRWMERVLTMVGEHLHHAAGDNTSKSRLTPLYATVLLGAGVLAWSQRDLGRATVLLTQSLDLKRSLGDRHGVAESLHFLGAVAFFEHHYALAVQLHEESLALRHELGDRRAAAYSLNNLGWIAVDLDDLQQARTRFQESCRLFQDLDDRLGIAHILDSLGWVAMLGGDDCEARSFLRASMLLAGELGDMRCAVASLEACAHIALRADRCEEAARLVGAADAMHEAMGSTVVPDDNSRFYRTATMTRKAVSAPCYAAEYTHGRAMGTDEALASALVIMDSL